ncbi:hypothetical protein Bca4012_016949 [Brassica carinata]
MHTSLGLLVVLTASLAIIHIVQAQDQKGFISLDCGLPSNKSPYKASSGLWYYSDEKFTQGGKTGRVRENSESFAEEYNTLRYFPDGIRNCYNLNVEKGRRYLVRATFVYGNYDGLGMKPVFDVHLGPNLWGTVDLEKKVNGTLEDMLHTATSNSMQICLVKTGETKPLISSLELRPLGNDSYITKSGSLNCNYRYYLSETGSPIRYSSDIYDRVWYPYFLKEWRQISTAKNAYNSNGYVPPEITLKTAATPTDSSAPLTIQWTSENPDQEYYYYAHFAEIEDLQANETREFNISWNGLHTYGPLVPRRRTIDTIFSQSPITCNGGMCSFQLIRTDRSTRPPLLNALEVYTVIQFPQSETDESDGLHLLPRTSTINATFAEKNSRRFTYSEVIKMTNNFQRVLGKGGFGMVYHGSVNGSKQVAVKVLSQSSTQGYKEFKAEVDLLLRVHHTNLVSLVGYCYEGDQLALVYEFLPNGDLKQHLSGKGGRSIINWSTRLQIALEAASGLEYLHIGCTPPMVHRDVKTANILLDANLKAKLADFGLSRSFQSGGESHETAVAGTLGYLDPEYHHSGRLGEKSDVYSFGIVLLEMITNQPVINQTSNNSHITQWVGFKLNRGDIAEIMDPNLHKDYDFNSAWRALELAMLCANPSSSKRPSMSQVIHEIKECIVCAKSGIGKNLEMEPQEVMSSDASMVPMAR